jgi:hypothetical protein
MEELSYVKNLAREVPKYTVRRFKVIGVDQDVFDRCKDGCFHGTGFAAVYSKSTQNSGSLIVTITVDTRLKPECFSFERLEADPRILGITVRSDRNVVDCILSVDLGNTRTSVLVIDQVNFPSVIEGGIAFYELPLSWTRAPDSCRKISGAFGSVISLVHSHEDPEDGLKLSFMRLGAQAIHNNRTKALHDRAADGVFSISSPKRYFFDEVNTLRPWLASARGFSKTNEAVCRELSGPLATSLSAKYGAHTECRKLPPSAMLSGMLVEIFEQACHFISSKTFADASRNSNPRRITHIHVTYPSTFSKGERDCYRRKLQQGVDTYLEQYRDPTHGEFPPSVEVVSSIDEATAVLAFYTHCEIKKAGFAAVWAATVGRPLTAVDDSQSQVRVGVIDIGGGTTDLAIANILPTGTPDHPTAATIQLLYQDGINEAGDNFIGLFIREVMFSKGIRALASLYGKGNEITDEVRFREVYNSLIVINPTLSREFWFTLAISFAAHLDRLYERGYDNGSFTLPNGTHAFKFRISEDVTTPWDQVFKTYDSKLFSKELKAGSEMELEVTQEDVTSYVATVRKVFSNAARTFGRLIAAFDCDQVLFAGKTSEFFVVRNVFEAFTPVPVMLSMNDYYAGDWCTLSRAGVVPDAKVSTAMGGAFCALKVIGAQNNSVHLSFTSGQALQADGYMWGVIADPKQPPMIIPRVNQIMEEGGYLTVTLGSTALYLARKRTGCIGTATLCYELGGKASAPQIKYATVRLRIVRNTQEDGAKMVLDHAEGEGQNGAPVTIDTLALRMCCFTGGKFWMDDGRI